MKQLLIILGFITGIIALILAFLPLSNLAYIPAVIALLCVIVYAFWTKQKTTSLYIISLLAVIALGISTYKALYTENTVGNTTELEQKAKDSENEAIEDLEDIDIDE